MKRIRELQKKDANQMLCCLNDSDNMKYLTIGQRKWLLDDCLRFIGKAKKDALNKHFAIIDDNNEWIGTISLKNIDSINKKAEFAIITDNAVHGKGYAKEATKELLLYAFQDLSLHKVYLNVISKNIRAIQFYKKCGFNYVGTSHDSILVGDSFYDLEWYEFLNHSFF